MAPQKVSSFLSLYSTISTRPIIFSVRTVQNSKSPEAEEKRLIILSKTALYHFHQPQTLHAKNSCSPSHLLLESNLTPACAHMSTDIGLTYGCKLNTPGLPFIPSSLLRELCLCMHQTTATPTSLPALN